MSDPLIVALALLAFFLVLIVVALWRLPFGTFIKFWGVLGPMLGAFVGTLGTYYFKQGEVKTAKEVSAGLAADIVKADKAQADLEGQIETLQTRLRTGGGPVARDLEAQVSSMRAAVKGERSRLDATLRKLPADIGDPRRRDR